MRTVRRRRRSAGLSSCGFRARAIVGSVTSYQLPVTSDQSRDQRLERVAADVLGRLVELFRDAQQLVVLGDAIGAARAAGLDLAGARGHGEVGNERVLGLAAAVADDVAEARAASHLDRLERLGQRADLIDLDQDGVARVLLDAACE